MDTQTFISGFKDKTGRLPTQVELSKELGISSQKAVVALLRAIGPGMLKPAIVEPNCDDSIKADGIQIGLYVIAALTFGLSVYFTGLWFMSMFNFIIAGTISVSMVSFMVLSPQAAMRVKGFVKLPLWGAFTIALIFSMGSTVAGQYNKLSENVDIESTAQRAEFSILRVEEEDLIEALSVYRDQQEYHQRTLERLTETAEDRIKNQAYAATERNKVAELTIRIEESRQRLNVVRDELRVEIRDGNIGVTEERKDFFSWIANLLGLTRAQAEFLIAALPAVFIDVIAALSLNLALRQRSVSKI